MPSFQIINKFHVAMPDLMGQIADLETLRWRKENGVDDFEKGLQMQEAFEVVTYIQRILKSGDKKPYMFSLHTEFDVALLRIYNQIFGIKDAWHHSDVLELASFILGAGKNRYAMHHTLKQTKWFKLMVDTHFNGQEQKHNAFYDCMFQIGLLKMALT